MGWDCCCSVAKSCPTLFNPMNCSMSGCPVLHYLPEFAQTHVSEGWWIESYVYGQGNLGTLDSEGERDLEEVQDGIMGLPNRWSWASPFQVTVGDFVQSLTRLSWSLLPVKVVLSPGQWWTHLWRMERRESNLVPALYMGDKGTHTRIHSHAHV